ncbi:hypothetical protein V1582_19140 [Enterobacter hormaechei subsp. xiangfangensis]|uniref:hypothetical protein n=1 Tax=Enterobacter hormaechei TaxID=158836 RepID=UPI0022407D12|nr:hypothetical protein [Enterobacter hormaechei]
MELSNREQFTKQQLINYVAEKLERIHIAPTLPDCLAQQAQLNKKALEIALAVLTSKPTAWADEVDLEEMQEEGRAYMFKSRRAMGLPDPNCVVELYRLPILWKGAGK